MQRDLQKYIRPNNLPKQVLGKEFQINDILEEFDFEKVHSVMVFLDWQYAKPNPVTGVIEYYKPTIEDIKKSARKYLEHVWDMPTSEDAQVCHTGSGGFMAYRGFYDGLKILSLTFEIEEWGFDYDSVQSENYS